MKKFITLCLMIFFGVHLSNAQPTSLNYEKTDDFFMDVIYNPDASIYQFLVAGLNSKNTELKEKYRYIQSQEVQDKCRQLNISVSEAYNKIYACWKVFLEVENTDLSYNGFGKYMMNYDRYNISAPRNCPNPELKHKLSIVPLKLINY